MIGEIRRRFALLTPGERLRWASMAPLGLASALLEALGGALVFALLTLLVDPLGPSGPSAAYGRVAGFVRTYVGPPDSRSSLIALAACAALVHIAKNLLLVGFTWWRARVVSFDSAALAARLLRAYVAAPWPFHLRRGSAALMENLRESPRPFFDIFSRQRRSSPRPRSFSR